MDMRNFITTLLTVCGLSVFGSQFYYNSFTTNTDANVLALATNIANGAIQGNIQASLTPGVIENAGGLDTNNYINYADPIGSAFFWYGIALNYAQTNVPANLVTAMQLITATNSLETNMIAVFNAATNGLVTASITNGLDTITDVNVKTNGFVTASITNGLATLPAATNIANSIYSNNPSGYLTPAATNNETQLGSNVVVSIQNGGGIVIATFPSPSGITVSLTATGTNNVNVTNLNATTLASYGAFTTNSSSWNTYVAPINDYTNAEPYTNGLLSASTAAATYQPAGNYLTPASSLNYLNITNPPTIPSTNGFVTASITNGLATTNYVQSATNGFVTQVVTNGLATTNYVNSITGGFVTSSVTNGLATTNFVMSQGYSPSSILAGYETTNSLQVTLLNYVLTTLLSYESNTLQTAISANAIAIGQTWQTNQSFIGSIMVSSNMTATFSTNNGVITATLGSWGGAIAGFQPASVNLTNWSSIGTNQFLLTTNAVTSVSAGTSIQITLATNASGIMATISSTAGGQSNPAWQSASFKTPASFSTFSTNIIWASSLLIAPTSLKAYTGGSIANGTVTANGLTGFTYSDSNTSDTNQTIVVIGFDE
jgi:hypothetical protein